MAGESSVKGPSIPSSNSGDSYIGSFISLTSKCDIRYEGVLCFLNIQDSTIGLKNVSSYGTEGRRKDGFNVPPSDKVYEYILFRGNDIKSLQIKAPPPSAKAEEQVFSDPAILQSQYSGLLASLEASIGGRSLTESVQRQDGPAMSSKGLPIGLSSHQSLTQSGPSNQSAATNGASHPSFSTPMYWQGHGGMSGNSSHSLLQPSSLQPSSVLSSSLTQNWMQTPETKASTKVGCGLPVSSVATSSLLNLTQSPSPTSLPIYDSLDIPSLLPTKTPISYSTSMAFNRSNIPSSSAPPQDITFTGGEIYGKICPDLRPIYPQNSVHHPASSFVDSGTVPLPTPPSLLTPDKFANPTEQLHSLTQNLTLDHKDMVSLTPTSFGSSILMPSLASQEPSLPLSTSLQKPQYSATQFTEEFDFVAMNEKFKKDEVWGSLGKATTKIEGVEDHDSPISLGDREINGMIPNPQSAYKKDDFFDTISCNSMTRGSRNGQNRLSARMKQDTETFGNFQPRLNVRNGGYGGGYGAGWGVNFRGTYNWGRGYGYGGRGRGPNLHF